MAQASEEDTSEFDELGDSSDIWTREVTAWVYMVLAHNSYMEKQKMNELLKEEALRRLVLDEKSEAYFSGWDDAMKRNSALEKKKMNMNNKRKREVEKPDDRDAQGRGKGRGSASSAGTGPTSVPHRPENRSSNAQGGGSASAAGTGPTPVPHRPGNPSSNAQGGGSASAAGTGPTSVPHRPGNPPFKTQGGGSASSASSGLQRGQASSTLQLDNE